MFLRAIWYWQASGRVDLRHSLCFYEGRTKCLFWFQGLIGLEIFQATGGFEIKVFSLETSPFFLFFLFFSGGPRAIWAVKSYSYLHKTFLILRFEPRSTFPPEERPFRGECFLPSTTPLLNLLQSSVKLTWEKFNQEDIKFLKWILIHRLFSTVGLVSHGYLFFISLGCWHFPGVLQAAVFSSECGDFLAFQFSNCMSGSQSLWKCRLKGETGDVNSPWVRLEGGCRSTAFQEFYI